MRAVTYDCWSTLIYERDPARGFQRRVADFCELLREAGQDVIPARAQLALQQAWKSLGARWMAGEYSGASDVARWALEPFGLEDTACVEQLTLRLQRPQSTDAIAVLGGAKEALVTLRDAGLRLGLVCDTGLTPGVQIRELLRSAELLPLFETLAFSDEVGVPKPHSSIFASALEPLAVSPKEAVHVGDIRRTDVAGGRAFGMGTIRIRDHHDDRSDYPEADAVADSHAHVLRILGFH